MRTKTIKVWVTVPIRTNWEKALDRMEWSLSSWYGPHASVSKVDPEEVKDD